jgi:hypothetical protein
VKREKIDVDKMKKGCCFWYVVFFPWNTVALDRVCGGGGGLLEHFKLNGVAPGTYVLTCEG